MQHARATLVDRHIEQLFREETGRHRKMAQAVDGNCQALQQLQPQQVPQPPWLSREVPRRVQCTIEYTIDPSVVYTASSSWATSGSGARDGIRHGERVADPDR